MTPWGVVLVCSWQRLLANRHSLPFPWTLSLHRRWCPSASHHPVPFLFLLALTFPLYFPFPFLGLSLRRLWCPSASHHSFPFHSLGRLCQRSPRTCPVSLLCVESTQRKANAFAVGQVRPSGHPKPAVKGGVKGRGAGLAGRTFLGIRVEHASRRVFGRRNSWGRPRSNCGCKRGHAKAGPWRAPAALPTPPDARAPVVRRRRLGRGH